MAATITPSVSVHTLGVGDTVAVTVLLDPQSETLNAVRGVVEFSSSTLTLESVRETDSVVNLWVEEPHIVNGNTVAFSGIIPGGFRGVLSPYYDGARPGVLFILFFSTRAEGMVEIRVCDASAFLHDGNGTARSVPDATISLTIAGAPIEPASSVLIADKEPPEPFSLVVSHDPSIFEGRSFLAFVARDIGSGIDHYEIKESLPSSDVRALVRQSGWRTIESPVQLSDQSRESIIVVKAVDRARNERTVVRPPERSVPWYWQMGVWGLGILLIIGALFIVHHRNLWRKRN